MPKYKALPPLEELQKEFNYDPETGLFTHAYYKCGRALKDAVAGTSDAKGYTVIRYKNTQSYLANRLAWLFITGEDPGDNIVDHEDRDKSNNRASNLRLADDNKNQWNRKARGWSKRGKKYQVIIGHYGKQIYLGMFSTAEEAEAAYRDKAVELRGEFAPQAWRQGSA